MAKQRNTKYIIKDRGEGGALPDNPEEMQNAVEARRRINEKALKGKVTLRHAAPTVLAGDTIGLKGFGPLFSGLYVVEKHVLELSASTGLRSKFDVSRNAVGDSGVAGTGSESSQPSSEATEGSTTTDEETEMGGIRGIQDVIDVVTGAWQDLLGGGEEE